MKRFDINSLKIQCAKSNECKTIVKLLLVDLFFKKKKRKKNCGILFIFIKSSNFYE